MRKDPPEERLPIGCRSRWSLRAICIPQTSLALTFLKASSGGQDQKREHEKADQEDH
jgi:hypothetical protein